MLKKCTALWREAHFEVKCTKRFSFGALLVAEMFKKCKALWRDARFEVKGVKNWRSRTLDKDLQRCTSRGRRNTRDTWVRHVRRSGRWFFQRGCILEHRIFSFAKMILSDRCSTSYDLASLFRGRYSAGQMEWKIRNEAVSSALNFPFLKEASQNCFVFDVVNFENWGSLAELLRFWCCQVQKLKKSRRIASFSSLHIDSRMIDNYSYNYTTLLVQLQLQLQKWIYYTTLHYTTLHYTTLHYTNYTTLITLHYTTLHYTTRHYITLHELHYSYKYNYYNYG